MRNTTAIIEKYYNHNTGSASLQCSIFIGNGAGLKLNLYDLIEELHVASGRPPSVKEITARDKLDVKATERLLNALVAFEILIKQGKIS